MVVPFGAVCLPSAVFVVLDPRLSAARRTSRVLQAAHQHLALACVLLYYDHIPSSYSYS